MMHGTWMNEKTDENCHPYYSDPIMDGLPMFGSLWYMVGIIGAIVLVMS